MEAVHGSEKRPWISQKINVKQFRDEWNSSLSDFNISEAQANSLTEEEYASCEEACSVEVAPTVSAYEFSRYVDIPPDTNFKTLLKKKEDLEKRNNNSKYDHIVYHNFKHYNYPPNKVIGMETPANLPVLPVEEPEIILNVQIFRPEKRTVQYVKMPLARMPIFKIEQEFMVLGCQKLTELRDKIECVSDFALPYEMSECPDMETQDTCKDLYKSGFFYIDGVLYNDMRDLNCRDYSDIIIKWSEKTKHGVKKLQKGNMEKMKFIDLNICLGYPYVYIHQGNCEHLLVFSDIKLMSANDVKNRNAYPMYVTARPRKRAFCMACQVFTAEWVVFGNKRLPENPFLFCKSCFMGFNYDEDNQKIGEFKAYRFIDRTIFDN